MKIIFRFLIVWLIINYSANSQTELLKNDESSLKFIGYLDSYYVLDTRGGVDSLNIVRFAGNSKFQHEFRLNIISFSFDYKSADVKAMIDLQFGDIPHLLANADESFIKYIAKAFIGYRIYNSAWLELGFLPDPVGSESSRPIKNIISSVSIAGYFEPDNFIGFKLHLPISDKLSSMIYGGNPFTLSKGKNTNMNVGIALNYSALDNLNFDFANIYGNQSDIDDTIGQYQLYNYFLVTFSPIEPLTLISQMDYAVQKGVLKDKNRTESMVSGFITAKVKLSNSLSLAGRLEYFNDKSGFMTGNLREKGGFLSDHHWNGYGMELTGASFSAEFKPTSNSYFRAEYSYLQTQSRQKVFYGNSESKRSIIIFNTGIIF